MTQTYIAHPTILQLEISSMCNALCFGCARTDKANFNKKLPIIPDKKILQLDVIDKFLSQFETVTGLDFCGTVDDPFMHPNFNEILELGLKHGIKKVWIHTNGSIRNTSYWKETAEILKRYDNHLLKFSIDGLSDTNHIYRQNTDFEKIIDNAKAFIESGGNAGWQYLVFPWNKHQVEEASKLSKEIGFNSFIHRIDRSVVVEKNWGLEDLQKIKQENNPYQPADSDIDLNEVYDIKRDVEYNEIDCYFRNKAMFFIDFNARLWPCCFIRNTEFGGYNSHWHQVKKVMFDSYGSSDWNRLDIHDVKTVLEHPFYKNDLVESFSNGYGDRCGSKLVKCGATCTKKVQETRPIAKFKVEDHTA